MKNYCRTTFKFCLVFSVIFFKCISAFAQQKDSIAVMSAAHTFINAFNHFNWKPFRESFTEDASIFFPEWNFAVRVSGKEDIEKAWLALFPEYTDNPKNDSLNISPRNISIQFYEKTAVMTFHLGTGVERLARRTIVWIKQDEKWRIAHLHASVLKKEN